MLLQRQLRRCFSIINKTENFTYEIQENKKIGVLTLTNPKKRNSLSIQMVQDLTKQLQQIAKEDYTSKNYTKVLILKADGPVFSAGHDLREIKHNQDTNSDEDQKQLFLRCSQMMTFMQMDLPQITIASVNNFATAAGCQLVTSCDLILASQSSKFSCPGVKIGLFCSTPGVAIARAMANQKKAFEMLVTGEPITGKEAYEHGMVNYYIERDEDLQEETQKLAEKIVIHSGETLGLGKRGFYQQKFMNLQDAYSLTSSLMACNLNTDDAKEGIASFTEKRHPHFKK